MTDTQPTHLTFDLGPVRCPVTGCWSAHGIPDQYTAARENALAEHLMSDEHRRNTADLTAAVAAQPQRPDLDRLLAAIEQPGWWTMSRPNAELLVARIRELETRVDDVERQYTACNELRLRAIDKGDQARARVAELEQNLAAYEALQLDGPNGRISNTCVLDIHPTWLRHPDDTRYYACPWCALDDVPVPARDGR